MISRLAGLPYETPNFSSNRHCASSMETMHRIAMAVMLDQYDCGIAFGVERMTRELRGGRGEPANITRVTDFNPRTVKPSKEQRNMPADHFDYFSVPIPEHVLNSTPLVSMVQTAQNVVEMYNLSREELDAFAMRSQHKLAAAYEAGLYKDEVMALEIEAPVFDETGKWLEGEKGSTIIFDRDESVRGGTTMEGLARLKTVGGIESFDNQELRITAGNSCPTSTGAAALLIMSEEKAIKLGLEPLARIIDWGNGGVKQQIMGLEPLARIIGTGVRMAMTLCKELRRSGKRYGLITQCVGAGQGATTIFESLDNR